MDELIAELECLTLELMDRIAIADDQELTRFVEQREVILNRFLIYSLNAKIQNDYKIRIENILRHDSKITSRMNEIKAFATHEISKISNGRMQKNGYEAEYQTADGVFFDRKK